MKNCIKSIQIFRDVLSNCCAVMCGASQTIVEVDTAVLPPVILDAARENPDVYSDCVIREKQPLSRFRFVFKNRVLIYESLAYSDLNLDCLLFMVQSVFVDSGNKRRCKKYVQKK